MLSIHKFFFRWRFNCNSFTTLKPPQQNCLKNLEERKNSQSQQSILNCLLEGPSVDFGSSSGSFAPNTVSVLSGTFRIDWKLRSSESFAICLLRKLWYS